MTLEEIKQKIEKAPTLLSADEEIQSFGWLMQVPVNAIQTNWVVFKKIMRRLSESHVQAFFEVTASNKAQFLEFAAWLDKMAEAFDESKKKASLKQLADHFRIDPNDHSESSRCI